MAARASRERSTETTPVSEQVHPPGRRRAPRKHYPAPFAPAPGVEPMDYAAYSTAAFKAGCARRTLHPDCQRELVRVFERRISTPKAVRLCDRVDEAASVYRWFRRELEALVEDWPDIRERLDDRIKEARRCRRLVRPVYPGNRWDSSIDDRIAVVFEAMVGVSFGVWRTGLLELATVLGVVRAGFTRPAGHPPDIYWGWMEDAIADALRAEGFSVSSSKNGPLAKVLRAVAADFGRPRTLNLSRFSSGTEKGGGV